MVGRRCAFVLLLFGLGHLRRPLRYLAAALAKLKHGPRHVDAESAIVARKERRAVLINVLRERAHLGYVFGPGSPQCSAGFFELMGRSLNFRIVREGCAHRHFGV